MTLIEQLAVIALIAVVETSLLVGRLWCFESGLVLALLPFALIGGVVASAAAKDRKATHERIPPARIVAMRRAS